MYTVCIQLNLIGRIPWNLIFNRVSFQEKITGRKRPALVDPSHKVYQGGKGWMDGQMEGWNGKKVTSKDPFRALKTLGDPLLN